MIPCDMLKIEIYGNFEEHKKIEVLVRFATRRNLKL